MYNKEILFAAEKIKNAIPDFATDFPADESTDMVYQKGSGISWTEGFWTGLLWLAYELTGDEVFKNTALTQLDYYKNRIYNKIEIETHDLGFLYTLGCVSAYKLTGNKKAKWAAVEAAEKLIIRFHEKGEFIQAWGPLDDENGYRLIIDCLLNLPLLYWASEETGDAKYADIAKRHLYTALDCVIRDDDTTHHTFYFDRATGAKLKGVTSQGYSDISCWARGQAWGVYGIALSYAYTKDEKLITYFNRVTDCFISKLPEDNVPYWDMIFTDGDEPRDTSAAAIAICGILEMNKYVENETYLNKAKAMMQALCSSYLTDEKSNGIIGGGMYNRPAGSKSECNIWGDYFFAEALMRFDNPDWKMYW